MNTRMVEVRAKVMKQNDLLARSLRERFQQQNICVIGLVSSPGSGKTAFLEKLLAGLARNHRVAALVGDLATENDAARLQRATPNVKQIITGTVCHLDASMIEKALEDWHLDAIDFLFIENVGNPRLSLQLRSRRRAPVCSALRHGRRRQAPEVPHHLQ
jgi:hydrogenase nickel incorporation protein HypB